MTAYSVTFSVIFFNSSQPIDLFSLYVFFPISDHVMLLEGIVSFKCRLVHVQMYA